MTLTETHRQAQLTLRAGVLRDLSRLWPAMDWQRIDRTFPLWSDAVGAVIIRNRATSSSLAAAYYRSLRFAAGITDTAPIVLAPPIPAAKLNTVLTVTAKASIKAAATHGVSAEQAMANAFVRSSGAVTRLVLEGGRETIRETTAADPRAEGWRRVVGANACQFCLMLEDRGAVYSEASVEFRAHDHCGCGQEVVFR